MRLRVQELSATVDLIATVEEIGELTKLATKIGYRVVVEPATAPDGGLISSYQVRFLRRHEVSGAEELISLALLNAVVYGRSGDDLLQEIRAGFETRHFPMDRPIADVMSIGGGPTHQGHDHESEER